MSVARPTPEQMVDLVESLGMTMTRERVAEFYRSWKAISSRMTWSTRHLTIFRRSNIHALRVIDLTRRRIRLMPGNAKTEIQGASTGKLKGKTVAVKDNVCVAGVPMMNGSSTLEGYVPNLDATIITRLLDAGATIKGRTLRTVLPLRRQPHERPPRRP